MQRDDQQVYKLCGHSMPIMLGYVVIYRLPKDLPNRIYTKFQKKFFGQDTSSHKGRYRYRRPGFLDEIHYRKLIRGVMIFREEDLPNVIEFLRGFDAEVHVRKIELTQRDTELLGTKIE